MFNSPLTTSASATHDAAMTTDESTPTQTRHQDGCARRGAHSDGVRVITRLAVLVLLGLGLVTAINPTGAFASQRHSSAVTALDAPQQPSISHLTLAEATPTFGSRDAQTFIHRDSAAPAPKGLPAFYAVPRGVGSRHPGELLKWQQLRGSGLHGTPFRVMYVSQSEQGKPVAVTGVVLVPHGRSPRGGYPVLSWAHPTNGMADRCAESLNLTPDTATLQELNGFLDRGWVFTATDYQGEGTPGLLPYLAGESAAHNVIDIVRAARHLASAHASVNYAVWGFSQGAQATLFAGDVAAHYAPDLTLRGVVAVAPPSQLNLVYSVLKDSPDRFYIVMAIAGLNAAYGDQAAPLGLALTPAGMRLLPALEQGCGGHYLANAVGKLPTDQVTKGDPNAVPAWRKVIAANDPQNFTRASPAPTLIVQGSADEVVPAVSSQILADHLCGLGQNLERWVYPGQNHNGGSIASSGDVTHWIADRFTGASNPDPYQPAGQANIDASHCPR